jgi:hypothetical protein
MSTVSNSTGPDFPAEFETVDLRSLGSEHGGKEVHQGRGEFLMPGNQEITRSTRIRKKNYEPTRKSLDFTMNMGLP